MKKILAAVLIVIIGSGYLSFRRFQHTAHVQGYYGCVERETAGKWNDNPELDCYVYWNARFDDYGHPTQRNDSFSAYLGID